MHPPHALPSLQRRVADAEGVPPHVPVLAAKAGSALADGDSVAAAGLVAPSGAEAVREMVVVGGGVGGWLWVAAGAGEVRRSAGRPPTQRSPGAPNPPLTLPCLQWAGGLVYCNLWAAGRRACRVSRVWSECWVV